MSVLENIKSPEDVKRLKVSGLKNLSEDIRREIISVTEKNGGHLSSNLGIIETTVALYHTFDFSKDKLIFDVGHQCYTHKILSDRKDRFSTIRKSGGISGFPNRDESVYDAFTAGHAGTSVAAGLGFCKARDLTGENYSVINIVGDGSLVNGLNLEAITAKDVKPKNFLVILNDNGMSISKNGNALYRLISKGAANVGYYKGKSFIKKIFKESFVTKFLRKIKNGVKGILLKNNFFEQFGFKYMGVADGNDVKELVKVLNRAKSMMQYKAVLLHIKTTKGKGLKKAEERSDAYHGVGKNLDISGGVYADALGKTLNKIIDEDKKVVTITAAMKDGTGLKAVEESHPENFFDVGIAEEFAVTLAAGMAAGGLKPVVAVYSTFMQRAYDEILHDVCLMNLPVVFCLDRAGLVGSDGATHQGVFDLSYLSSLPNMTILAPVNEKELSNAVKYALSLGTPVAIRYPRSATADISAEPFEKGWQKIECFYESDVSGVDASVGKSSGIGGKGLNSDADGSVKACEQDKNGGVKAFVKVDKNTANYNRITILSVGPVMTETGIKIAKDIQGVCVYNAKTVKPLDEKVLTEIKDTLVVTLEENAEAGGFGSAVLRFYADNGIKADVLPIGVKDSFVPHGSMEEQRKLNGLDKESIERKILERLKNR